MLVLTRKPAQLVLISPKPGLPAGFTVEEGFAEGPLWVVVRRLNGGSVSLGIEAPGWLYIERGERGLK